MFSYFKKYKIKLNNKTIATDNVNDKVGNPNNVNTLFQIINKSKG